MYSEKYEITDHVYEIRSFYGDIHKMCCDYRTDKPTETVIEITEENISYERSKAMREAEREGVPFHELPSAYLETLAVYRKLATHATSRNMFLFHCSTVAVDGVAYSFAAKSGTGKSTHTALWRKVFGDRAVMINDDKPIIGIVDGVAKVYGTPWNGKHGLGENTSAPLKAICFLTRGEKNRIRRINDNSVIPLLLNQTFRPREPVALKKTLSLLDELTRTVEFYILECNMEEEAAWVSYNGMNGINQINEINQG